MVRNGIRNPFVLRLPAALRTIVFAVFPVLGVIGESGTVDFARVIRPLLSDRCFSCHGPDSQSRKAGLRLDLESSARAEREGIVAIVPGRPDRSELIARISSPDPSRRMPPPESGKTLTPEEAELIRRWIAEGAPWSGHWGWRKPALHPVPEVADASWPGNWIDSFILSQLESRSWGPSGEASPAVLVRRLSLDLTGLPPSPEVVAAFETASGPRAYRRLVDSFLASPAFGERMAMYWLDLVRFADTVGYHGDQDHNVSPYRDYVIDAFNDGMPFDRFTREQLAGDLLAEGQIDQRIATAYHRLLQTSHEGGVQPREYLAIYGADRVRNLSAVWLGATMGCAQCHDHKYDPITSRDFYALQAFFADIDDVSHLKNGTNELPTRREPEIQVLSRRERQLLASLEREIAALRAVGESASDRIERLLKLKERVTNSPRKVMVTRAVEPRTVRLLRRGDWLDETGPVVRPATPVFLGQVATVPGREINRLDLADWLTDPESGNGLLTARVFVNRFWYLMFGSGLSRSLDDFGAQGEPPLHLELLDRLAIEFVRSGWDIKHVFRLIASSRTYRQDSFEDRRQRRDDPYNRLFSRQGRYRHSAETIRDIVLSASGLLVADLGGASVRPYQPPGHYRHLNFPKRTYAAHEDGRQWRRGLYVHWQRQFLHPTLAAFDAPNREECIALRPVSNTPAGALALLNDPSFLHAATELARSLVDDNGVLHAELVSVAFRKALSRKPDNEEMSLLMSLAKGSDPEAGAILIARVLLNLNETVMRY